MKKIMIAAALLLVSIASVGQTEKKVYKMGQTFGADSSKVSGRSFPKRLVLPKGAMGVSLQASLAKFSASDFQAFAMMTGFNGEAGFARVAPAFSYAYANNNAIGIRLGYTRLNLNIPSGTIRLFTDDLKFDISGINTAVNTFGAEVFNRSWFGLDEKGRFSFIADVSLGYGLSMLESSATSKAQDSKFALTFSPGMEIFVINELSLFFSLNLAQLSYDMAKCYTITDGNWAQTGSSNAFKAQIRLNLTDFNFGLAYYF